MSPLISVEKNLISEDDKKYCIETIDKLKRDNKLDSWIDNETVLISKNHEGLNNIVRKYSELAKEYHKKNSGLTVELYTSEAYVSLWQVGSYAGAHIDSHSGMEFITHSTVAYLNDDYEGGEIYFPNHSIKIKPESGDMIFFPSGGHEFSHGVSTIRGKKRYTISFFHTLHYDYAPFDMPDKVNKNYRKENWSDDIISRYGSIKNLENSLAKEN